MIFDQATNYSDLSETQLTELQKLLSELGYYPFPYIDGLKGYISENAIKSFAQDHWLNTDSTMVLGETFEQTLREEVEKKDSSRVTKKELREVANNYGLELPILQAFLKVEAGGKGFIGDHPKILFEAHYFYSHTNGKYGNSNISSSYWNSNLYSGGKAEYSRLAEAMSLDYQAALKSFSIGLGQVMTSHWKSLGARSPTEFVKNNHLSEKAQVSYMMEFLRVNNLLDAARRKDWHTLARGYNGSGYKRHNYHIRLAQAYRAFA